MQYSADVGMTSGPAEASAGVQARRGAGGMVSRPALVGRLGTARVTLVSAPAGSGKTVLLRSWVSQAALAGNVAWVSVERGERDPQRFWLSVLAALRQTAPGLALVRTVTAVPDLDGWAIVERLLADLAPLADQLWLLIDDVHELGTDQALRQLELLIMRAPPQLRFVLATRHDVRLGLHRLRLEGGLAEIREPDLRFSLAEAQELFDAAGVGLPGPAVAVLHERTEGWGAGLRLAALSLAGHPDPERFAEAFSGTERTVAEYLLAEVLDRQPEQVRRLLLRTSILERVNGELAGLLTGDDGGEQVLLDLEQAGAFVVSLDAARSWFRYHQMFAGLLRLELRRTAPGEVAGLHRAASSWLAAHGFPVEAIQHAQEARDWSLAGQLLTDHWPRLHMDRQAATHELLARFPPGVIAADAELAAMAAADELAYGSLEAAERYLDQAGHAMASVPEDRHVQARLLLGMARLGLARQRGNPVAAAEEMRRLEAPAEDPGAARAGLSEDLRAVAVVNLGMAEVLASRIDEAERHLGQGVALAQQTGRTYLEFSGRAYQSVTEVRRSAIRAAERSRQAIELAERHGWTDDPTAGVAYTMLADVLAWQGRPQEAEPWVQRAERTVRAQAEPTAAMLVRYVRGLVELGRGRYSEALAGFEAADQLAGRLAARHLMVLPNRAVLVHALTCLGENERAGQYLAGLSDHDRQRGEMRVAEAALRLAEDDPPAAAGALGPVLDGSAPAVSWTWLTRAFLLEAIARDALGDQAAAGRALERALDFAERDGVILPFLLHRAPGLLQRQAEHRTAHPALIADILSLLAGSKGPAAPARGRRGPAAPHEQGGSWGDRSPRLTEPLSSSEIRVLRYLPTNLPAPQIASELFVSHNTVRTHMRNLYTKLGTHSRADTVARARALGLLAPSPYRGQATVSK
jgi:LuxR family maltose regulon positive regulatory protein